MTVDHELEQVIRSLYSPQNVLFTKEIIEEYSYQFPQSLNVLKQEYRWKTNLYKAIVAVIVCQFPNYFDIYGTFKKAGVRTFRKIDDRCWFMN